jgi:hypothetical protein
MKIRLTRYQRINAKWIGEFRCWTKPKQLMDNDYIYKNGVNGKSHVLPHYLGAAAEIAYARMKGVAVDTSARPFGDKEDFSRVEVKAACWQGDDIHLKISVKEWNFKKPGRYVLCRVPDVQDPEKFVDECLWVEVLGEITRKKFDEMKTQRNCGNRDNYIVGTEHLSPVEFNQSPQNMLREADYAWMTGGGYGSEEHRRFKEMLAQSKAES